MVRAHGRPDGEGAQEQRFLDRYGASQPAHDGAHIFPPHAERPEAERADEGDERPEEGRMVGPAEADAEHPVGPGDDQEADDLREAIAAINQRREEGDGQR